MDKVLHYGYQLGRVKLESPSIDWDRMDRVVDDLAVLSSIIGADVIIDPAAGIYNLARGNVGAATTYAAAAALPFVACGVVRQGLKLLPMPGSWADDIVKSGLSTGNKGGSKLFNDLKSHQDRGKAAGVKSAITDVGRTEEDTARLVRDIFANPAHVDIGKSTEVYNAAGQGVRFDTETKKFIG